MSRIEQKILLRHWIAEADMYKKLHEADEKYVNALEEKCMALEEKCKAMSMKCDALERELKFAHRAAAAYSKAYQDVLREERI